MGTRTTLYRFGEFTLDPRHRTLLRRGQLIPITPKCFETLTFLIKNRGQLVPKDQLMEALWPESFVEEANLKQNIYVLRRILGDDSNGHSFIATVPRRGYKFIGPVTETELAEDTQPENGNSAGQSSAAIQYWAQHSPFRGLQVFEPDDAWLFFGRESETDALVERIGRSSVVVVTGNSGCGKSSLVRAGLIPAIRYGGSSESWRIALFRPSANPFDYLAEVLPAQLQPRLSVAEQAEFTAECRRKFADDPSAVRNAVSSLLSADRHPLTSNGSGATEDENPGTPRVLLVADQFEEIFTLVGDLRVRTQYIDTLLEISQCNTSVIVSLVLVLRADFYSRCLDHAGLSRCLETSLFNVPRLAGEKLRENIEKRLELAGACAEPGLIDRLLEDVGSEPGNLALLEHALDQLWAICGGFGHTLTNSAYAAIGGLRGALGKHADRVYEELAEPELKTLAQRIFLELVHLGEDADRADFIADFPIKETRRRVSKSELLSLAPPDLVEQLIARLASARLISTGRESEETFVEVSHEALIRGWPRLREWLAENRDQLRFERRLHQAAEEWEALRYDPGALLQGTRLAQAEEWLPRHDDTPNTVKQFVEASLLARGEAMRKEREAERLAARRLRWFTFALAIMLVAVAGVAWRAYRQQIIEKSRALAAQSGELVTEDRGMALNLALKSWRMARTDETYRAVTEAFPQLLAVMNHDGAVLRAVFSPDGQKILTTSLDHTARVWSGTDGRLLATLRGHTDEVLHAEFSSDSTRIVTASSDHTARVWNTADGHLLAVLKGHTGLVYRAAFSLDGKRVVTAGWDKTARVWNSTNGRLLTTLQEPGTYVLSAVFSPDGRTIATANGNRAHLWDSLSGHLLRTFEGHTSRIDYMEFSPDGERISTAGEDGTARIWHCADARPLAVLRHDGPVTRASFSRDGQRVVTISSDHTARIWNAHSGALFFTLPHDGAVQHAEFSSDGRFVLTGSFDHRARLWSGTDGRLLATFPGHTGIVYHAAFSPSGDRIVTASEDGTARLWYTVSAVPTAILPGQPAHRAAFSPDSSRIITSSAEGTTRVWDASTGRQLLTLNHEGPIFMATFSPDGDRIVTIGGDRFARVWNARDGRLLLTLRGHTDKVGWAQFSPDGQRIVTTSSDRTARLWNAVDGQPIAVLHGHAGGVYVPKFSPNGQILVTTAADSTLLVWNGMNGRALFTIKSNHKRNPIGVFSVAVFSSDSNHIVTTQQDQNARVWSSIDGHLELTLKGHKGLVWSASFSPDDQRILTTSADHTARVWSSTDGRLLSVLQGHTAEVVGGTFSPDGQLIVTADWGHTARLWRASDGRPLLKLEQVSWRGGFSPNGQRVLTTRQDLAATRIWKVLTLDDIARILAEH